MDKDELLQRSHEIINPDVMVELGFRLISSDKGFWKFETFGGKATKHNVQGFKQILANGQQIVYFNTNGVFGKHNPQPYSHVEIQDDGGTRKTFVGVIRSMDDFKLIINLVR